MGRYTALLIGPGMSVAINRIGFGTAEAVRQRRIATLTTTGWVVFTFYVLFIFFPQDWHASVRLIPLGLSLLWSVAALWTRQVQLKLSLPVLLALVAQVWAFISFAYAYAVLHRQVEMGPQVFFLAGETLPAYSVAFLLFQLDSRAGRWVPNIIAIGLGLSAMVGAMQWLHLPFGDRIAEFVSGQDLGFGEARRAQGLAGFVHAFAQHLIILSAILGSHIFSRRISPWILMAMLAVAPIVVATQGRAGTAGYVLFWGLLLFFMFRVSKKWFFAAITLVGVMAGVVIGYQATKLFYFANVQTQAAATFMGRAKERWVVAEEAFREAPIMGVGPDAFLYRGRGEQLPDKFVERPAVIESAFLFMLSQFGIPGLLFLLAALAASTFVCFHWLAKRSASGQAHQVAFVGLIVLLGNGLDYVVDNGLNQPGRNALIFLCIGWISAVLMQETGKIHKPGAPMLPPGEDEGSAPARRNGKVVRAKARRVRPAQA